MDARGNKSREETSQFIKDNFSSTRGKKKLSKVLAEILNPNVSFDDESSKWCKWLISGGVLPKDFFKKLNTFDNSLVCGLVWNANFFAYRCRDCGISPCMSLCADCFLGGDHTGHDFNIFKSQAGGACDCGDETVMKKEGFCENHKERHAENKKKMVPNELIEIAQVVISEMLICLYKKVKMKLENDTEDGATDLLSTSKYLLSLLNDLAEIDCLRGIISDQLMSIVDPCDQQQETSYVFTTQEVHGRQTVRTTNITGGESSSFERSMASTSYARSDGPVKPRHSSDQISSSWLAAQTYLEFFMELLVKAEFPRRLATFLLQLLPNPVYKELFTRLFCRQYTAVGNSLMTSLNPSRLSSHMVHVSVQLFSNEQLAYRMVVEENLLTKIIFVLDKMVGQCLKHVPVDVQGRKESVLTVDCDNKILSGHCYWPITSDLTNILSHLSVARVFLQTEECVKWLDLVSMLFCMNINQKKFLVYTEFESRTYYTAFSIEFESAAAVMWEIYRSTKLLENKDFALKMVRISKESLSRNIMPSKLSKCAFSYHLTLHRYFALFLSQTLNDFHDDLPLKYVDEQKEDIIDHLINTMVATEEVRNGFWLYNGQQINYQAQSYLQSYFCNSMFDLDIYLLQVCLCQSDVDQFIAKLADRCYLYPWLEFSDRKEPDEDDEEKYFLHLEGFLNIILNLLCHRVYSGDTEKEILRKDVLAHLFVSDRTHSQLVEIIPSRPGNAFVSPAKCFDEVLQEVAIYKSPAVEKSNLQQGIYTPKDDVWETEFDYQHIYMRIFKKRDQQQALERYTANMKKRKLSSCTTNWRPSPKLASLYPQYQQLLKILESKKLHQILIFTLYKICTKESAALENLKTTVIHFLQLFADHQCEIRKDENVCENNDDMIKLTTKYIECLHNHDQRKDLEDKINQNPQIISARESGECSDKVKSDVCFLVLWLYRDELLLPMYRFLEEEPTHSVEITLRHLRVLLSHLPDGKLTLLKRCIQYSYHHCQTTSRKGEALPYLGETRAAKQVIKFLFHHFDYLFKVGRSQAKMPNCAFDIALPHTMFCENAHTPFTSGQVENLRADCGIDFLSSGSSDVEMHSSDTEDCFTQLNLQSPDEDSSSQNALCLCGLRDSTQPSLLKYVISFYKSLPRKEVDDENETYSAGRGMFYTKKLLRTLHASGATNRNIIEQQCAELFTRKESPVKELSPIDEAKLERRRKAAERRKLVLEEFASKQKKFLDCTVDEAGASGSPMDHTPSLTHTSVQKHECVICFQRTESTEKKPIGLIVLMQSSSVLSHQVKDGVKRGKTIFDRQQHLSLFFEQYSTLEATGVDTGTCIQSCGHYVHISCQQSYFQTLKDETQQLLNTEKAEYTCPLCRGFSNGVLPVIPPLHPSSEPNTNLTQLRQLLTKHHTNMSTEKRRKYDVSVLSSATTLLCHSLNTYKDNTQQLNSSLFSLLSTARYNLEVVLMNFPTLEEIPEQKRNCLIYLMEALHFSLGIGETMVDRWNQLVSTTTTKTCTNFSAAPLLFTDPVSLLLQFTLTWPVKLKSDVLRVIIQLIYNLCYVQALITIGGSVQQSEKESWLKSKSKDRLINLASLVWRWNNNSQMETTSSAVEITQSVLTPQSIEYSIQNHCLPYLKTASLLLYLYEPTLDMRELCEQGEFAKYASILGLASISSEKMPSSEEVTSSRCLQIGLEDSFEKVIDMWWKDANKTLISNKDADLMKLLPPSISWGLPKLVELPNLFDRLFQKYRKRKCSRCKKIPDEPTLCLVCGKLLCFHSQCCANEHDVHECTQHSRDCGRGTGVFLGVSSSVTLVIREERICLWGSVYLDSFGEEDRELKRGKPLFLSEDRYKRLEEEWRKHLLDKSSKRWGLHFNQV